MDNTDSQTDEDRPLPSRIQTYIRRQNLQFAFFGTALAVLTFYILWIAQGVLVPFVTAIFLSFLIMTVKQGIDRIPLIGRYLPDPLGFTLAFLLIASILLLLAMVVRDNIGAVLAKAPDYRDRFATLAANFVDWADHVPFIPKEFIATLSGIVEAIGGGLVPHDAGDPNHIAADTAADSLKRQVLSVVQSIVRDFTAAAGGLAGALVTTFLYTAFILVERGRLIKKVSLVAQEAGRGNFVEEVLDDVGRLVRAYISIKTGVSLFVALVSYAIMSLLGTDFAGFWALLIFAFGFVPIVGAIIAITLPTVLTLVQPDGGVLKALLTLVLLAGTEQVISSVVEPRLLGKSLNLSPLVILLSLATWGTLWGFPGMLLCVPMTVTVLIFLSQMEVTRPIAIMLSDDGTIAPLKTGRLRPEETVTAENSSPSVQG